MGAHARLDVLGAILRDGLVPSFHHEQTEAASAIARALVAGGARVLEFLHRSDRAYDVFRELRPQLRSDHPDVVFGIGTMVDAPTTALYLAQGADFVVGPNLSPAIARLCNRRKVAYLPGCGTVSEISDAEELGCEIVKLFPSSAMNGPEFVRSLLAPMPWTRVMPTGNAVPFSESAIRDWLAAGACAVGMGGSLVDPQLLSAKDFAALSRRTQQVLTWISSHRRGEVGTDSGPVSPRR